MKLTVLNAGLILALLFVYYEPILSRAVVRIDRSEFNSAKPTADASKGRQAFFNDDDDDYYEEEEYEEEADEELQQSLNEQQQGEPGGAGEGGEGGFGVEEEDDNEDDGGEEEEGEEEDDDEGEGEQRFMENRFFLNAVYNIL